MYKITAKHKNGKTVNLEYSSLKEARKRNPQLYDFRLVGVLHSNLSSISPQEEPKTSPKSLTLKSKIEIFIYE